MIKNSDKNNQNVLRILKVMANKDFLAIDDSLNYYIISTLQANSQKISNKIKLGVNINKNIDDHIIQPFEIMQLDNISYYVLGIGRQQAVWIKNIEQHKIMNSQFQFSLFEDSIRCILRILLLYKLKNIREYMDVRNFVLIKGSLHFLLIPRGQTYRFSLKRSQKSKQKSPQSSNNDSISNNLSNELSIIKQFGLILQQIFNKKSCIEQQEHQSSIIWPIIKEMINKNVTYEYIEMKLGTAIVKKRRTPCKLFHLNNRYFTESIPSEPKVKYRSLQYDKLSKHETDSVNNKLKSPGKNFQASIFSKRRVYTTQANYKQSSSSSKSEKGRLMQLPINFGDVKLSQREPALKKRIQQNQTESQRYKDWISSHKFELSFKEKVKRQGQIARQKFRKSLEIQQSAEKEDDRINDEKSYNIKLMKKLKKLKTENQKKVIFNNKVYQNLKNINFQMNEQNTKQITKKLNFESNDSNVQKDQIDFIQTKYQKPQIKTSQSITKKLIKANHTQNNFSKNKKQSVQTVKPQYHQTYQLEKATESNIFHQEVIQYSDKLQLFSNVKIQEIKQGQSEGKAINSVIKNAQLSRTVAENNKINQTQNNQLQKPKKQINIKTTTKMQQLTVNNDEIQQVKLGWNNEKLPAKVNNNGYLKQQSQQLPAPTLQKRATTKSQMIKYDSVAQSYEEYISMINILGNICVKCVKNKNHLAVIEWRKAAYFIYQRFCYEREKVVKSLHLGASQVFRKGKIINFDEWQHWLANAKSNNLILNLQYQNVKIRQDLNKFGIKVIQTCKLSRRYENYIIKRQKILSQGDHNTRYQLSQFAIGSIVELYDSVIQRKINKVEIAHFLLDSIFALRIICQLDGLASQSLKYKKNQYEKYDYDYSVINGTVEQLYRTYFQNQLGRKK